MGYEAFTSVDGVRATLGKLCSIMRQEAKVCVPCPTQPRSRSSSSSLETLRSLLVAFNFKLKSACP